MNITKAAQAARVLRVLISGSFEEGARRASSLAKVGAGSVEVLIKT
jgi:hypothetical protein